MDRYDCFFHNIRLLPMFEFSHEELQANQGKDNQPEQAEQQNLSH